MQWRWQKRIFCFVFLNNRHGFLDMKSYHNVFNWRAFACINGHRRQKETKKMKVMQFWQLMEDYTFVECKQNSFISLHTVHTIIISLFHLSKFRTRAFMIFIMEVAVGFVTFKLKRSKQVRYRNRTSGWDQQVVSAVGLLCS